MKPYLSLVLAFALALTGCSAPAADCRTLSAPVYPEMAPYPDESRFIDTATGEFDDEGFYQAYDLWCENRYNRFRAEPGYADNLKGYFSRSIPAFLSGDSNDNILCSPLNLYISLALLAESTGGSSRDEILTLMNCGSIDALRQQANQIWITHYCDDGATTSILANSLWLDNGLTYDAGTADILAKEYCASVFQGDLGSESVNAALRDWLNAQTGGLLQEQTQNLQLDPQTVLALASTIYYRAKWDTEFQPENNTQDLFYSPTGEHTLTYMNRQLTYGPYYWGEDFGAVALALGDGETMWLILPDAGLTPADILASGHATELVLSGGQDYENQKRLRVNLKMPKFDVSSDLRLEQALQSLGITAVFDPAQADFSPILPTQEAWLDTVNHATRVTVDEEGVEAAAYTVMMAPGAAMPPEDEMDFTLDRPFLFVITSRSDLPLFAGVVNAP